MVPASRVLEAEVGLVAAEVTILVETRRVQAIYQASFEAGSVEPAPDVEVGKYAIDLPRLLGSVPKVE